MARTLAMLGILLLALGLLLWRLAPETDLALLAAVRAPAAARVPLGLFTDLGGVAVQAPLALAAAAMLLWRGERARAGLLALAVVLGRIGVEALKEAIARPRPPLALHLATVESMSMPSSHTACASFTCLIIAAAFGGGRRTAAALAFAAAIGLSRVALGVHFPSDVLAGWGVGLLWSAAWWRTIGAARQREGEARPSVG